MSEEGYKPSEEEIKSAEEMMTEEQRLDSYIREASVEYDKTHELPQSNEGLSRYAADNVSWLNRQKILKKNHYLQQKYMDYRFEPTPVRTEFYRNIYDKVMNLFAEAKKLKKEEKLSSSDPVCEYDEGNDGEVTFYYNFSRWGASEIIDIKYIPKENKCLIWWGKPGPGGTGFIHQINLWMGDAPNATCSYADRIIYDEELGEVEKRVSYSFAEALNILKKKSQTEEQQN